MAGRRGRTRPRALRVKAQSGEFVWSILRDIRQPDAPWEWCWYFGTCEDHDRSSPHQVQIMQTAQPCLEKVKLACFHSSTHQNLSPLVDNSFNDHTRLLLALYFTYAAKPPSSSLQTSWQRCLKPLASLLQSFGNGYGVQPCSPQVSIFSNRMATTMAHSGFLPEKPSSLSRALAFQRYHLCQQHASMQD